MATVGSISTEAAASTSFAAVELADIAAPFHSTRRTHPRTWAKAALLFGESVRFELARISLVSVTNCTLLQP